MDAKTLVPLVFVIAICGPAWCQDGRGVAVDPFAPGTQTHRGGAAQPDFADPSKNPYDANVPDNPYDLAPAAGSQPAAPYSLDALSGYGRDLGAEPSYNFPRPGAGAKGNPYSAPPNPYAASPTPYSEQSAAVPDGEDALIQGGMSGLDRGLGASLNDPLMPPPLGSNGGAFAPGSVAPKPYAASRLKPEELKQDSSGVLGFNPYDAKSVLAPTGQSGNQPASDAASSLFGTALSPAPASQGAATLGAGLTSNPSGSRDSSLPSTLGSPIGPSIPGAPTQ
jgi:hypothetical protein